MKLLFRILSILSIPALFGCSHNVCRTGEPSLEENLLEVVNHAPGTVGIAFVSDNDTVLVNNGVRFPMMSVFKMHESLAVAHTIEQKGTSLDSIISIRSTELDPTTWSPMLKTYGENDFEISIGELVNYALVSSDNNASNILFDRIVSPAETDAFIRSVAADTTFAIRYSEGEMKKQHDLSYLNYSSPLSAALLIGQIFTTDIVNPTSQKAIRDALTTVTTGQDRVGSAVADIEGVLFAHKTGSGYRNENDELVAFNDVAYIRLPDGRDYRLAVMIRDFSGSEAEAAKIMAEISGIVYRHMTQS